ASQQVGRWCAVVRSAGLQPCRPGQRGVRSPGRRGRQCCGRRAQWHADAAILVLLRRLRIQLTGQRTVRFFAGTRSGSCMTSELKSDPSKPPLAEAARIGKAPQPSRSSRGQIWTVNFRVLIWTAVILAVSAPALYFWHEYQLQRQTLALFERAQALHDKEKW